MGRNNGYLYIESWRLMGNGGGQRSNRPYHLPPTNAEGEEAPLPHCVSQVYSSALPMAYTSTDEHAFEEFARIILDATYQATFAVAAIKAVEASNNNSNNNGDAE